MKTYNTNKDNSTQLSIILVAVVLTLSAVLTSCSSSKVAYTPKKVTNKKLIVCNHIGCYAKN